MPNGVNRAPVRLQPHPLAQLTLMGWARADVMEAIVEVGLGPSLNGWSEGSDMSQLLLESILEGVDPKNPWQPHMGRFVPMSSRCSPLNMMV